MFLVHPASVGAEIAAPEAEGTLLRLDRIEGPALEDVGRRVVLILGHFARVAALHSVSPVRPGAVSETTARRDPEIIAAEGHGAIVELLVVAVAFHVGDFGAGCPAGAMVGGACRIDVERRHCTSIGAVADRARSRVTRVVARIPP